jgi:hypothetical protein
MDKVVHFEIPADDVARAKDFYGSDFGWRLDDMEGMDYTIVRTVEVEPRFLRRARSIRASCPKVGPRLTGSSRSSSMRRDGGREQSAARPTSVSGESTKRDSEGN